jgi:acetyl esterase/lipase
VIFLWLIIFVIITFFILTRYYLSGEDLSFFDKPTGEFFDAGPPCDQHDSVVASLHVSNKALKDADSKDRLAMMRSNINMISAGVDFAATFTPVDADGIAAEWVVAPGVDSSRRALYIHGGGFIMGSPGSHRVITAKYSEVTNAAVLAIDYRLMPEYSRMAGIDDCRNAYLWLLKNGVNGPEADEASRLFVAGDSAGGNLTLSLLAWLRDNGIRSPDAAIAFSPVTDSTYSSPSLVNNLDTDPMLGMAFKLLTKVPKWMVLLRSWQQLKQNPSSPVVSPVYGDLSGLPPTLLQASSAESLYDDARRYVNRAQAAGSPVELHSWTRMVHVWQFFYPRLPEAGHAWDEVQKFINKACE